MSEENIDQEIKSALAALNEPEEIQDDVVDEPEIQEETIEDKAKKQGWKPESELEDKSKFVPPDEFMRRKPLFDKIHEQSRLIKDQAKAVENLLDSVKKIEERTRKEESEKFERKLEELTRKRREAIENADPDEVDRIETQIDKVKSAQEDTPAKQPGPDDYPNKDVVEAWAARNTWFDTDDELREYMELKQTKNLQKGMTVAEALIESERQVKAAFAHKFQNPNKEKSSPVIPKNPEPKRASIDALTPEMKTAFRIMQKQIGMTLEEYIGIQKSAGNL